MQWKIVKFCATEKKKIKQARKVFFSCVQNLQIALLVIMLQQGKDLAFFRNRETSKGRPTTSWPTYENGIFQYEKLLQSNAFQNDV